MTIRSSRWVRPCATCSRSFVTDVLALDPCVSEEFLKLYVAYKAETNFVDIVPQKSRLRLSLNMQFHELHDPKGLAKDITNLGRWGNGDVEVRPKQAGGAAIRDGSSPASARKADWETGRRKRERGVRR